MVGSVDPVVWEGTWTVISTASWQLDWVVMGQRHPGAARSSLMVWT